MVRLIAVRTFTDSATGKLITEGEAFECADAMVNKLVKLGCAKRISHSQNGRKSKQKK